MNDKTDDKETQGKQNKPDGWPESWIRWLEERLTPEEVAKSFPELPGKGYGYGGPPEEDGPVR